MLISQELYIFLICSSIICLLFTAVSCILSAYASIKVIAMEKSTHTVTFKPIDEAIDKENQEFMKKMNSSQLEQDDWATTDVRIKKRHEEFIDTLKQEMPEFVEDKEEKKIYSF